MKIDVPQRVAQVVGSLGLSISEQVSSCITNVVAKLDGKIIYEEGDRVVVKTGKSYFLGICEGDVEFGKKMGGGKGYQILFDDGSRLDVKSKDVIGLSAIKKKKVDPIPKEKLSDYLAEVTEE